MSAHDGYSILADVRAAASWDGEGSGVFGETVGRSPTTEDVSNAQWVMNRAGWACEVLAGGIQDCQERIQECRDRIDSLCIAPDGDITDEQRPIAQAVHTDASGVWDDYRKHIQGFEQVLGELVDRTIHAVAPPGFLAWAGNNIAENWNGFFDEGGFFNRIDDLHSPLDAGQFWFEELGTFYGGMWEGVTEMWDGALAMVPLMTPGWNQAKSEMVSNLDAAYAAYQDDPRQFLWDTGQAVLDYETLRQSPTRWAGKLLPTIALSAIPGAGPAAITTRTTALTTRLTRLTTTLRLAGAMLRRYPPYTPDSPLGPHPARGIANAPPGVLLYRNRHPEYARGEFLDAFWSGLPTVPRGPAFDRAIARSYGAHLLWVIRSDGTLLVVPRQIGSAPSPSASGPPRPTPWPFLHHPVPAFGDDVLAAGETVIVREGSQYRGMWISNFSGHYHPRFASLDLGRAAFERYGITFDDLRRAADDPRYAH